MAFIVMRQPAYDVYVESAPRHGLTPVADQQLAGALMLSLDFFVVLFALSFFFWRAAQDEDASGRPVRAPGEHAPRSVRADLERSDPRGRGPCNVAGVEDEETLDPRVAGIIAMPRRAPPAAISCGGGAATRPAWIKPAAMTAASAPASARGAALLRKRAPRTM